MTMYILLVLVIMILGLILKEKNRKCYCIIVGIILLTLIGCRHKSMGIVDTEKIYIPTYEKIAITAFKDIDDVFSKDLLFHYSTKIFICILDNVQLWIALVAFPLIYNFCKLVYKYSKCPPLSFILFISLNYYGMCFTLMRHSIALAIIIFSYKFIKEKKIKKFVIAVLIASMFHETAIVFLIAYPLFNVKFNAKYFILILLSLVVSVLFGEKMLSIALNFLQEERFQSYTNANSSLSLTNFYINLLILICTYLFYNMFSKGKDNKEIEGLMNLNIISCIALAFSPVLGEMYRIAMFFGIFNTLLLPNALALKDGNNQKYKTMIYLAVYLVFIVYFFAFSLQNAQIIPYKFFWE